MSLEHLPNELLLIIYSYLNPIDVLQAFYNLNYRLNSTIINYTNKMDLTRIRYEQFNQYCHMLTKTDLGLQLKSLSLSNNQPVVNQLMLLKNLVWPLDEKIPNLECLILHAYDCNELNLFLSDIISCKKLIELNIAISKDYERGSNWKFCFNLIRRIYSLEKFTLKNVCLPLEVIDNRQNTSITYMNIQIKIVDDLIIVLNQFRNLSCLDVSIERFEVLKNNHIFDDIISTTLNKIHIKILSTSKLDRTTFDKLLDFLASMPTLQYVNYEIYLRGLEMKSDEIVYLNGQECEKIRKKFDHLLEFDFTICTSFRVKEIDAIHQEIIESFTQFSHWTVDVFKECEHHISVYIYTKVRRLFDRVIDDSILYDLSVREIVALLDSTSSLCITVVWPDDDDENKNLSLPSYLTLSDQQFSYLVSLTIAGDDTMYWNEYLECFLKQLFSRTPNLKSITIISDGVDNDHFNDISNILNCIEKPSMSIKNCTLNVRIYSYDEFRMKDILFHLPMLTSLVIERVCHNETFFDIVNACVTHAKRLSYLKLEVPGRNFWANSKPLVSEEDNQLWFKENTLLGDPVIGKGFYAIFHNELIVEEYAEIWFE